ncbi:MAG TPA: gliding motility-associated C-terminal domain-containing protein [Chitinophagaceae bacterium]
MRSILLPLLSVVISVFIFSGTISGQVGFSFNCTKDTIIPGCTINPCFTIKSIIPDIHGATTSYTVSPISLNGSACFPVYANPGILGTPTNLIIDDRYTPVPLNIGFTFPFYGVNNTQLVASTNGFISFDISKANLFSHYAILRNGAALSPTLGIPENLPSALYDAGLIMGPYHDLNPAISQPGYRINYTVTGTAPHRRWILSYFKLTLFGAGCNALNENTHQIVLYESTGMIEVLIFSKETCTAWNLGRAIVGIQNFTKDQALMAPGRAASDAPWGALNMNEGWRFIPAAGPSLFKRVELYNLSGTLLATGTTTNAGNGLLEASFPNICPPPGATTSYIIKSFYSKIDDINTEIFAADTVRITKGIPADLNATAVSSSTTCGPPSGSITVTVPTGTAPYTFVLDGGPGISGSSLRTFTGLAAGPHTIVVTDASGVCSSTVTQTVNQINDLKANITSIPTSCPGASNGRISVTPTNGTGPYTFVLNPGTITQVGNAALFTGLASGSYSINITDAAGCSTASVLNSTITDNPGLSTTASHTDALCNGVANGTITVTQPSTGTAPYEYSLNGVNWQTSNVFPSLAAGTYTVRFRESSGCQGQLTKTISQPVALTASASSIPVVCNGQNNGTIIITANGGIAPYQYSMNAGATWQSNNTFNVGAGNYTVTIRDANLCIATQTIVVSEPVALTATAVVSNKATCGNDGAITISANGGNGNYQYSINGISFQASNVLNAGPGTYTATIKDNLGCTTTVPNIIVGLTNDLTYTQPTDTTICEGSSVQLQIVSNAVQYSWSPATGLNNSSIRNPIATPVTTTTYTVTLTSGSCTVQATVTINVNAAPIPDAGIDGFICIGQTYQLNASGGIEFSWTPSTFLNSAVIQNPVSQPDKTITYALSVKDAKGCSSLIPDNVTVNIIPPINVKTFPFDTIVHSGDQFQLLAVSPANNYTWTPSAGLSNPTIANPVVTAGAVGDVVVYKVTSTTNAGCNGEGFVRIRVFKGPDLYVPTGFTPNGDGLNDKFFPLPVGIKVIRSFKVFNRWGQIVYSTSTINAGWDGKFGGRDQANGVYVWMVEGLTKDNKVITKRGTVTLVR